MVIKPKIFPPSVFSGVVFHAPKQCQSSSTFMQAFCERETKERWAIAAVTQVHRDEIWKVPPLPDCREADGLCTQRAGICLTIRVADCAAVLFADPETGAIAAIHAGWRGLRLGIVAKAVRYLCAHYGCDPTQLLVYVSPCISAPVYEVGAEVAAAFPRTARWDAERKQYFLDLRAEVLHQLECGGVQPRNVEVSPLCTYQTPECSSYRRDGTRADRMIAFIGWYP